MISEICKVHTGGTKICKAMSSNMFVGCLMSMGLVVFHKSVRRYGRWFVCCLAMAENFNRLRAGHTIPYPIPTDT